MSKQIQAGEKIPNFSFFTMKEGAPVSITTDEIFSGKKVVLFAVPGAFTPGCSKTHCPSFVAGIEDLKKKGVQGVYCVSVNDAFVMEAWGRQQKALDKIVFLADGSGKFTQSIGMTLDLTEKGLGVRSQRYAMIVEDGVVKYIGLDPPGQITNSTAEHILSHL